jgi:hypothetical protein
MDWASVVSIAITGLVGIAGVAGTILAARIASKSATKNLKLSINAENYRVDKADKRRIYAACQVAFDEVALAYATSQYPESTKPDQEARDAAQARLYQALAAMYQKVNELQLIAPLDIADATEEVTDMLSADSREGRLSGVQSSIEDPLGAIQERRGALFRAMRADLSETVELSKE